MLVVEVVRRCVLVAAAATFVPAACAGSSDNNTVKARCERLLDHVIDVRLESATNVDVAAHRKVMQQALGRDFVARCANDMSETQIECALAAKDSDAVAACSRTK